MHSNITKTLTKKAKGFGSKWYRILAFDNFDIFIKNKLHWNNWSSKEWSRGIQSRPEKREAKWLVLRLDIPRPQYANHERLWVLQIDKPILQASFQWTFPLKHWSRGRKPRKQLARRPSISLLRLHRPSLCKKQHQSARQLASKPRNRSRNEVQKDLHSSFHEREVQRVVKHDQTPNLRVFFPGDSPDHQGL